METKIIQISTNSSDEGRTHLYALDSDGDVWDLQRTREGWIWAYVGSPFNEAE